MLLGAVAFAFILSYSDIGQVATAFEHFPSVIVPLLFGLVVAREAIRVVEWRYLLARLKVRPRWRHTAEALLAGDAGQILPAGIFLENYVLRQMEKVNVSRSLAATISMQFLEAGVALVVLAIVPIGNWWWLRWASIAVLIGFAAFLVLVTRQPVLRWIMGRDARGHFSGWLARQVEKFGESVGGLLRPSIVLSAAVLTGAYLVPTIAILYVLAHSYHLDQIGWLQAAVVYCFSLVIIILNPLPSDWGVSEGTGTAAFIALRVSPAVGLTLMLLLRFTILLATFALVGVVAAIFRQDVEEVVEGPPIGMGGPGS